MEQSAFEALMIGVNVFVFIVALSAAIMLMSSVIDMVNFANERAIVGMNGTLAQSVGVVNERIYTGAQMLTYYRKQLEIQDTGKQESDYVFNVKLSELGQEKTLERYMQTSNMKDYLNKEFTLQYKGKMNGKYTYVFSLRQDEESKN